MKYRNFMFPTLKMLSNKKPGRASETRRVQVRNLCGVANDFWHSWYVKYNHQMSCQNQIFPKSGLATLLLKDVVPYKCL